MFLRCGARCSRPRNTFAAHAQRYSSSEPIIGPDTIIPPASPRFVYVPEAPQRFPDKKRQRKGTLPEPRSPLQVKQKELAWHLENTAPAPVSNKQPGTIQDQHKDSVNWKAEESRLRRENFVAGYESLRRREYNSAKRRKAILDYGKEERQAKQLAPEPGYEEMSRPSVLSLMTDKQTWRSPKMSAEEIAERRARFQIRQQAKEDERRADAHTLYVNAKNFIVNNEQLEKRIMEVFHSPFYEYNKSEDFGVWDEQGWPEDTAYLMGRAQATMLKTTESTNIARRRITKIAEDLTGGKLEPKEVKTRK